MEQELIRKRFVLANNKKRIFQYENTKSLDAKITGKNKGAWIGNFTSSFPFTRKFFNEKSKSFLRKGIDINYFVY